MSIKVGVRARPFSHAEIQSGSKCCLQFQGKTVRLFNPSEQEKYRDFLYDYTFRPHQGIRKPENREEALHSQSHFKQINSHDGQGQIFKQIGLEMLSDVFKGYNCCLFAYGETGSGKSHTMLGNFGKKGILLTFGQEMFNRTIANSIQQEFRVKVSMIQIRGEKIQDLLVPFQQQRQSYKIREHRIFAIYVDGIIKENAIDYYSFEQIIQKGLQNRAKTPFQVEQIGQRKDLIIQIQLNHIFKDKSGRIVQRCSKIQFADLSGIQKMERCLTGDRLKDAVVVNKSLPSLGNVISKLSQKCQKKSSNIIIPYRDSSLTRLLQGSLGGNCRTTMLCTVSPSTSHFEETLSTLRYGDRARTIINHPIGNQYQSDEIRSQLRQQKQQLNKQLTNIRQLIMTQITDKDTNRLASIQAQIRFIQSKIDDFKIEENQQQKAQKKQ